MYLTLESLEMEDIEEFYFFTKPLFTKYEKVIRHLFVHTVDMI